MGKKTKFIMSIGAILAGASALNNIIFKNAEKNSDEMPNSHIYKHIFGNISYYTIGEGTPILLIHSLSSGASYHEWDLNIEALSENHKLYVMDLIGFGNSQKPNLTYSPYLYVEIINDFICNIIKEPVGIIASSNSAAFCVMCYKFSPKNFTKMLLISPTGMSEYERDFDINSEITKFIFDIPIIGTTAYNILNSKYFIKDFMEKNMYYDIDMITNEKIDEYYNLAHKNGFGSKYSYAALLSGDLYINIEKSFSEIKIPIYLIWGNENTYNSIDNLYKAVELNPNLKYSIFENSKMMPQYEEAEKFNSIAKSFFI